MRKASGSAQGLALIAKRWIIICCVMSNSTTATALLLAGPSSAGKTTLAVALQRTLPEPWVYLPAEVLTDGFPRSRPEFISAATDRRLRHAALRALAAFMDSGFNVIGEAYVWDPGMRELAVSVFARRHAFVVELHCDLRIREQREVGRAVTNGFTRMQEQAWNWDFPHDLALDTGDTSPDDLAATVTAWLSSDPVPAAFRTE